MHIQNPSIVKTVYSSIFKDIQAHSGILMHIQPHSHGCNQGGEGRPPLLSLKTARKCPNFGKKGPNCVNLWVKSSIQNVVLGVCRRKKLQDVSLQGLFFCSPSWPEKFWLCTCTQVIFFLQNAPSQMFDSVLNTAFSITAQIFVQEPYDMYCIRHIQNFGIFSTLTFFRCIPIYSIIFSIIKAYSRISRHD